MSDPRLVLCGGLRRDLNDTSLEEHRVVELNTLGPNANVYVKLEDVARVFLEHLSPKLTDLIEIASYIYAADTATGRGQAWRREFHFVIPVREFDFWIQEEVTSQLVRILNFLTDDSFSFEFRQLTKDRAIQEYLEFGEDDEWPFYDVDNVIMFSGGLDSLAGAAEMASNREKLVLVSHRPAAVLTSRQKNLFTELKESFDTQMLHVPVCINKHGKFRRDSTQRSRSFLFSALGFVVAESVRGSAVRFYENGIVSLNLPIADEVVGARASRTTHPWVLKLLTDFFALFSPRSVRVDNPYLFMTKADVVSRIAAVGAGHLVKLSCSCSRTMYQPKSQRHCGTCSQCIDRRIGILAAGQEHNDIETDYVSDVFVGPRKQGYEQNIAVNYVRHAIELCRLSETEFSNRFASQILRAVRDMSKPRNAAERIIEMHQRHGRSVEEVLEEQLKLHIRDLLNGRLEPTSLLAKVHGQRHLDSTWTEYANRIHDLLAAGLPVMCRKTKPKNEPQLQEWCEGILKSNGEKLTREFPFMKWATINTKPDWADETLCFWIELKYVRRSVRMSKITDEIAADITKYRDNDRKALFVIYDPYHLVTNDLEFAHDIERHDGMYARFVR